MAVDLLKSGLKESGRRPVLAGWLPELSPDWLIVTTAPDARADERGALRDR